MKPMTCAVWLLCTWFVLNPANPAFVEAKEASIHNAGKASVATEEKKEILKAILRDEKDEYTTFLSDNMDEALKNMTVDSIKIHDSSKAFLVNFSRMECGNANCMQRIVEKKNKAYRLLLSFSCLSMDVQNGSTKGYRDLKCVAHNSSISKNTTLFKYSGKIYKAFRCWEGRWTEKGYKQVEVQCE